MEKAIDFCFRTEGAAGSVAPTQIAIARFMAPIGVPTNIVQWGEVSAIC